MAIFGFRFDIFVIIWFLATGMVNYLDSETGIFGYAVAPKYNATQISQWAGINVGGETTTIEDTIEPRAQPEEMPFEFLGGFIYFFKALVWVGAVLWNSTIGLHLYLRDHFGIAVIPWGLPIMILTNLINFLGLWELYTKVKP